MSRVIIIGCGGVASVAIHKCCQLDDVFTDLCIASRTVSKCDKIKNDLIGKTKTNITTRAVDASSFDSLVALFKDYKPEIVMHLGMPYHNLTIMDACLECGCHYLDTAAYEPEDVLEPKWRKRYEERVKEKGFTSYFDYSYQWEYMEKFKEKGLVALLGCGFDPGVTQAYVAYAKKHEFDTIETLDILDCNGGDHGYPFATNFNPEINLREVSSHGAYVLDGKWHEVLPMSIHKKYDFDGVGVKDMYLLHHEEIESINKNFPEIKRIKFYMTFGESYLRHMKCLENVGLLSTTPIDYEGHKIVPIQFLKALLPDPSTLGPRTKGKTNIGCIFDGYKDGIRKQFYIYNVCDHEEAYKEVGSQAISYTTGVPAMVGAMLVLKGIWTNTGVHTLDELDPDPFIDGLNKYGLPSKTTNKPVMVE